LSKKRQLESGHSGNFGLVVFLGGAYLIKGSSRAVIDDSSARAFPQLVQYDSKASSAGRAFITKR
jgi:hypothetical protein